jgi:gliding motility-associated-like protein
MMMKKIILFCFASALAHLVNGQTFVNNGAIVSVTAGGIMIVKTDSVTSGSGSLENIASTTATAEAFRNAGNVTVQGSFIIDNGAEADGFGGSSGQYWVQGDWDNSGAFTADNSTVYLYGSLPQQITGASPTTFYNLNDTMAGVKTQSTVDASVGGVLTLAPGVEHATTDYNLTIINPATTAIVVDDVNSAFVSSTANGRLIRNTNQQAEYIFPTGINESGAKIREASITPASTIPLYYRVRYADDPGSSGTTTADGYPVTSKSGNIQSVNNVYYHIVTASNTTVPADLAIFYDRSYDDSAWSSIASWQPQWVDLQSCSVVPSTNGSTRLKVVKTAWTPVSADTAFALTDTVAVAADFAFPNAFVGDCQTCTGSSANDGDNGSFGIINVANIVTLEELSVFNRWGEMVFDSKRDGNSDWNGKFRGKLQPQGNYVYRAVVRNNASGKQYPLITGNVALLW